MLKKIKPLNLIKFNKKNTNQEELKSVKEEKERIINGSELEKIMRDYFESDDE